MVTFAFMSSSQRVCRLAKKLNEAKLSWLSNMQTKGCGGKKRKKIMRGWNSPASTAERSGILVDGILTVINTETDGLVLTGKELELKGHCKNVPDTVGS